MKNSNFKTSKKVITTLILSGVCVTGAISLSSCASTKGDDGETKSQLSAIYSQACESGLTKLGLNTTTASTANKVSGFTN